MKFVLAPDKYKGSLSAVDAGLAMERGIRSVVSDAECVHVRIGDGGEGTAGALARTVRDGKTYEVEVTGPLGDRVRARYVTLGRDNAVAALDMADAAGLTLVPKDRRDPMAATTFGVGELILSAATNPSVRHIVVGLGGSATTDCGVGCLQALGVRVFDAAGSALAAPALPADLAHAAAIDFRGMPQVLRDVQVTLACDVDNPLCGPNGAAYVFGPQKGATPETVEKLDLLLGRFGAVLDAAQAAGRKGCPIALRPGAGAAGGLGAALMAAFPAADCRSGIEIVLEMSGFDAELTGADLIITGEGRLDGQTLSGKAVAGILRRSAASKVPVAAIVGSADPQALDTLRQTWDLEVIELVTLAGSAEAALSRPAAYIEAASARLAANIHKD